MMTMFCILALLPSVLAAQTQLTNADIEHRVDLLLRQMTLDEKVGQLVQYNAGAATGPGTGRADYREQIARGQVGSFLNATGAAETNRLQRIAVEQSRLKIPLLFGLDIIHGYRTIFPVPLGMASTWDPQLIERASRIAAREATADGVRWTFSPMVDIARDARWGRIVEGAGEDPYLGSAMAAAYVRGYQGAHLNAPDSLAACAKHYVAYGAAEGGRDYNAADMSERTLRQIYLPPFEAALRAGVASFMSAFNTLNDVPGTANRMTLTGILRGEWGFQGLVVSDWNAVAELVAHGVALDGASAAKKAILAGVDIDMESGSYARFLAELVRSGALPEPVIDEAVRRVLRVKFALGLFDRHYTPEASATPTAKPDPESVEFARMVAERSLILLRNEPVNGVPLLPLSSSPRKIALIGPFGDNAGEMLGAWGGKGDPRDAVTLRSALQQQVSKTGGQLFYAQGTDIDGASESGFREALDAVNRSDVVIAAMGEDAQWMTAEAASRAHIGLPGNQEQLLEKIAATGKPVVLIVFSGRPLALKWAADHIPSIVQAWYPGMQAGTALARALYGDVNFSGRLTVSMPRAVGQEPLYYNALNTGRPAGATDLTHPPKTSAQKYVSRYIDEENAPLFPFGYGLSYTRFTYSPVKLSMSAIDLRTLKENTGAIRASAEVTNAGTRAGREVVQLYIQELGTSVAQPVRELKGFRVISLAPGETRSVEFTLGRDELSFWNIDMHNTVEPARINVWISPNSSAGQPASFSITE